MTRPGALAAAFEAVDAQSRSRAAIDGEAQRQQALLAALRASPETMGADAAGLVGHVAEGLVTYRANVAMVAGRVLAAAFPTVQAMVRPASFARLAEGCWHVDPPERGDVGVWGARFAAWLVSQPGLGEWPYLADCARLDWALHTCERAADAAFGAASLQRLEATEPQRLQVRLMPGVTVLASAWPIATIHAAHRTGAGDFMAAHAAIAARRAERVLVARDGWRAVVHRIDAPTFDWTVRILAGVDLGAALAGAMPGFDFGLWLATALRAGWLQRIDAIPA